MRLHFILLLVGLFVFVVGTSMYGLSIQNQAELTVTAVDVADMPDSKVNIKETTPEIFTGKDNILALQKLDKNLECNFIMGEGEDRREGTGFFNKGNVRVDTIIVNGSSTPDAAYMIINKKDDQIYIWNTLSANSQGMKMSLKEIEAISSTTHVTDSSVTIKNKEQISPETTVNYNCKPWTIDSSVFVPPVNVKFIDIHKMGTVVK